MSTTSREAPAAVGSQHVAASSVFVHVAALHSMLAALDLSPLLPLFEQSVVCESPIVLHLAFISVHVNVAVGQGASALAAVQVTDVKPDFAKPSSQENVTTLLCLSPLLLVTDAWSGALAPFPVHFVCVHVAAAVGHAVSAFAALQMTDDAPDLAKPSLQENVATLLCLLPSLLATEPLAGALGSDPVHFV